MLIAQPYLMTLLLLHIANPTWNTMIIKRKANFQCTISLRGGGSIFSSFPATGPCLAHRSPEVDSLPSLQPAEQDPPAHPSALPHRFLVSVIPGSAAAPRSDGASGFAPNHSLAAPDTETTKDADTAATNVAVVAGAGNDHNWGEGAMGALGDDQHAAPDSAGPAKRPKLPPAPDSAGAAPAAAADTSPPVQWSDEADKEEEADWERAFARLREVAAAASGNASAARPAASASAATVQVPQNL